MTVFLQQTLFNYFLQILSKQFILTKSSFLIQLITFLRNYGFQFRIKLKDSHLFTFFTCSLIIKIEMKKPKHYYCHRSTEYNNQIPEGYKLIDKIGEGAFGQVYKVFNTSTSSIEVMKKIKTDSNVSLTKQSQIMSTMNSSDGFAKIKDTNSNEGFLIMTLLGDSLESILQKNTLNIVDLKRIAYQCILRLKELHERGYVHRDLKPDNVLLGNQNNPHKIYLVDFGLSSTYKKTAKIPRKCYSGQIGTIKFCPLASHYCYDQFPKDDLESLGYLLVYIINRKLPWSNIDKSLDERQKFDEIKRKKQSTQIQTLTQGISCLRKYFKLVKSYKIGQQIDYSKLLQLFFIPCEEQFCYSFCKSECFAKLRSIENTQQDDLREGQGLQSKIIKQLKMNKKK